MDKPKLSFDDLCTRLNEKNISFNHHSKEEVITYLKNRSYYYKISSYRKLSLKHQKESMKIWIS